MDGVEVKDCFEASKEEGFARVWERDKDGELIIDDGGLVARRLEGKVVITQEGAER